MIPPGCKMESAWYLSDFSPGQKRYLWKLCSKLSTRFDPVCYYTIMKINEKVEKGRPYPGK